MEDETELDEQELLAAAANWAESGSSPETKSLRVVERKGDFKENGQGLARPQQKTFSLHVTQLSYDATDYDIRDFFISKGGCRVTSVRLVYTKSDDLARRQFKGVAFVDVADEASFTRAMELHRRVHLGRRINVRPTCSKEELGQIAHATKEKVNELIQASANNSSVDDGQPTKNEAPIKPDMTKVRKGKPPVKKIRRPKPTKNGETWENKKLTKKERNRKAAILLSRRFKRNK